MVMPAQQPQQGMSISDILSMAQMMKKPEAPQAAQPIGDVPSQTTYTYTRQSGAPTENGVTTPVPPVKPAAVTGESTGTLSGILSGLKGYFGG